MDAADGNHVSSKKKGIMEEFKLQLKRPLCVFDLETTGLRLGVDRIVEIAIVKVFPDGHTEELSHRLNPEIPIPAESSAVHHIHDADVAGEPTFKEYAPVVLGFIGNSDLAGFNSNKFDVPMLVEEFLRVGLKFEMKGRRMVDVQNIFHKMEPRNLAAAEKMLRDKFAKKPMIAEANIKVLNDGYNYGANTHASVSTYKIESKEPKAKGLYMDVNGNKATAYGLMAAAEKAGLQLYLGSYPITPATDILHELAKHKSLGVKTVQCEDEIAGCASAVGASFAGALAVTTTSGPGVCLKSEAMNLAVIAELPLVVVNVQRGGPSTGLPTKSEQTDLLQALYGRNGESPMPVIAATSPTHCFEAAYMACKLALEHMTPVVLLTDAFVANGSAAWKLPNLDEYPAINPPYVSAEMAGTWTPYLRNPETGVRYWAVPGTEGFMHRIGGLEKSGQTGAISTEPENHNNMVRARAKKIEKIADCIPPLEVVGDTDAELLIVGWGGTYGHLRLAMDFMRRQGHKVALAHFSFINPLPKNTAEVLMRYPKVVVAEQNMGQLAGYLQMRVPGFAPRRFNQVKGQPFVTRELIDAFTKILED